MPEPTDGIEAGHTTTEFQLTVAVNAIIGAVAAIWPDKVPPELAAKLSAGSIACYGLLRTIRKAWGR